MLLQQEIEKRFSSEECIEYFSSLIGLEGWSVDNLKLLINTIKPEDFDSFASSMDIIKKHRINDVAAEIFTKNPISTWSSMVYNLFIKTVKEGKEKDEDVLLAELSALNPEKSLNFKKTLEEIQLCSLGDSKIAPQGCAIKDWSVDAVKNWANVVKKNPSKTAIEEILAAVKRAGVLSSGWTPRVTQIISILALLKDKGKLLQISTGEGKSTIVAMFAAIKALQGEKVDVVTSSPILAKRDSDEMAGFYKIFGITVDNNVRLDMALGARDCYLNDVVYGDASSFQFDLLRDEYNDLGTRANRAFGTVIIDEVDSMLIDESAKIAKLSGSIPYMEYLEPILIATWVELKRIEKQYVWLEEENRSVWINGDFEYNNGKLALLNNAREDEIYEVENRANFSTYLLEGYLENLITSEQIQIPIHLKEFAALQVKAWAKSAVKAGRLMPKHDYVIIVGEDGKEMVSPVDFVNTGIIQEKTQWTDGIHQFLQIKHGLRLTSEGLTTSFISNLGYFKRYGEKIYGMTGTLGSKNSQNLLTKAYPIDLTFIPTYKEKQFVELEAKIASNEQIWRQEIVESISNQALSKRAILVICETISATETVLKELDKALFPMKNIKTYYRGDESAIEGAISAGQVIIATNLAGRGTDIKTTAEVEQNGGLHVCLTFLPHNLRVEQQALGRTSRQGKKGSGQLIINSDYESSKLGKSATNIKNFRQLRDELEAQRLEEAKTKRLEKIIVEDELFNRFNKLLHELKSKKEYEAVLKNNKPWFERLSGAQKVKDVSHKLSQVEELWGLWLKKNCSEDAKITDLFNKFEGFKAKITKDFINGDRIMRNPAYATQKGARPNFYQESIQLFKSAENLDPSFTFAAHYNMAESLIRNGTRRCQSLRENEERVTASDMRYVQESADCLMKAKQQIENVVIPLWQSSKMMLGPEMNSSDLAMQILNKVNILQIMSNRIDDAINVMKSVGEKEEIVVSGAQQLEEISSAISEIQELKNIGLNRLFTLKTQEIKKKKNWFSAFAVTCLGIGQMFFGGFLCTIGFGGIGGALISEGVGDMVKGFSAAIGKKNIDMDQYWAHKGLSMAVSLASVAATSFGKSLIGVKQGAVKGASQVGSKTLEKGIEQGVKTKVVENTVMNQIGARIGGIALNEGIKFVGGKLIENNMHDLTKDLDKQIEKKIKAALDSVKNEFGRIVIVDSFCGKSIYQDKLQNAATKVLNSKRERLLSVASQLTQSALTGAGYGGVALVVQAGVAVKKVDDTLDVIEEFCDALRAKVKEITSDLPGIVPLTWERMTPSLNEHECWEIVELLKNKDIVAGNWEIKNIGFIPLFPGQGGENDPIPNVNLGKYEEFRKRIANIINDLAACQHMNCTPAFAAFASNTCSMVTSHVAGKIQCAAIDPLIAIGADSFVDKIMPKYEFIDRQDAARKIVKVKRKQALGVSAGDQPDFLDNITSLFHKQTIEEQQFQEEISEQQRSDNQLIKQMDADNRAIDIVVNQQQQDMQIRDRQQQQQRQMIEQKLPKFETNPLTGNQIISQNIIDSVFGANYNQHATVGPIEIAQQNVEMNWQNINQMQIIYENQRNQRSIIDPFGRVLYDNSKLDNRRMLAIAADKVIDLSRNYEEWQKEHPYIDKILLPILPATTGAILGGITGGMTGGPLGILPGIGIGAVAATVSTIKSQLVSLAVGQLGGEEAKRFIMEKGTESFKALDPTLTNDQAHALAAAVLISMTSGAQLKQVIKSTASLGGAFKQDKASMGMNFFASKGEGGTVTSKIRQKPNYKYADSKLPLDRIRRNLTPRSLAKCEGKDGIHFSKDGYPNFEPFVQINPQNQQKYIVKIENLTGKYDIDNRSADKKAGITKAYRDENGLTWHHHEDGETLLLVPGRLHKKVSHAGGVSTIKKQNRGI